MPDTHVWSAIPLAALDHHSGWSIIWGQVTIHALAKALGVAVLDDLLTGAHLAVRLPGYLHRVIDFERGRALIRRRLEQRSASFLELARLAIYAQPTSPYRALLEGAGCDVATRGEFSPLPAR